MLNLGRQVENTSGADIHGAIRKTSLNVLFKVCRDCLHDLEMAELLADIFQGL